MPGNTDPSSRASNAGPRSPTRGSTIELARGWGGVGGRTATAVALTRPSHENATGPTGSVDARTHDRWPPFRPHRTGPPASQDRPSRMVRRVAGSGQEGPSPTTPWVEGHWRD